MEEEKTFEFTYSASERRNSASQKEEGPEDSSKKKALRFAVLWGIGSCLLFGLGLTFVLEWIRYFPGICCGLLGMAGMAATPALYQKMADKASNLNQKKKD